VKKQDGLRAAYLVLYGTPEGVGRVTQVGK